MTCWKGLYVPGIPLQFCWILVWMVAAPHVDNTHLQPVNHQPFVIGKTTALSNVCQGATDDKHVRTLPPDFELVELLVAHVVGNVLDQEHDDGLGSGVELPRGNHGTRKPR